MNMFKYIISLILFFLYFCSIAHTSYAIDLNQVYAYPVPFIPDKHGILTIKISDAQSMKCTIYDINGDIVKVLFGTTDLKWNGRNDVGKVVAPGLYIIKIELEKTDGEYRKKIIRILVQ
ncbi:MAG: T9SS type A sorting domain-containing protein [Spirochaetes bacterium]|nr:T9SS type A sorting domain-containing protein [Spirochaetota bacterium]